MDRLHRIREKLTWSVVVTALLYLAATVVLVAVLLPSRNQAKELRYRINDLARQEQELSFIVAQKARLESEVVESRIRLAALGEDIPSQYDLPRVQDALARLSEYYGLTLISSDHVPMQVKPGDSQGVIPLTLTLQGNGMLLSYVTHMQEQLPTLRLKEVIITYIGEGQFDLRLAADLHVLVLEQESLSNWVIPSLDQAHEVSLSARSFGLSFNRVAKFFDERVKVLGVIVTEAEGRVLLSKDGVRNWYRAGDGLDEAVVSRVVPNGVWLNVDGVQLKLEVGS
ncbi:MAG: hypothetical protein GX979_04265 [Firmicutes bacterium]|nr:hypothetical protein [Bacillota bacterium]